MDYADSGKDLLPKINDVSSELLNAHEGKHRQRPAFKSAAEFCREYEPLTYAIEPIVRTSSIYSLTARTGSGKTAFAVIAALAVATGRNDLLNMEVAKGRVAYCAFENPDDVRMRIMAAANRLNINPPDADEFIVIDGRRSPEGLVEDMRQISYDGAFTLILIDTLAAAFDGNDLNDNVGAGEFVRRLRPLTQLDGKPAVIIAAHPIKNASNDNLVPYGAGAVLNEVDGNLTLSKRADTGHTVLHWQGKFRGIEFEPRHFQIEVRPCLLALDSKGRPVPLPVLVPASAESVEQRVEGEAQREIKLLKAMSEHPGATQRELETLTGIAKTTLGADQRKLTAAKMIEKGLDRQYRVTPKGTKELDKLFPKTSVAA